MFAYLKNNDNHTTIVDDITGFRIGTFTSIETDYIKSMLGYVGDSDTVVNTVLRTPRDTLGKKAKAFKKTHSVALLRV